jgi:hypothetical protein
MQGSEGYVGYGVEVTEGTLVAPTIFVPVSNFDFSDTNEYIIPDQIRGSRSRSVAMASAYSTSGTMEQELTPRGIAALLKSAWAAGGGGTVSSAYTGGGYEHEFTPGNVSPTFTFEASAGDVLMRRWGGIRVNTLEITAAFNEIVTASWGMEGTTRGTTGSPATETYLAGAPFHFTGASVKRDGTEVGNIKSFTFGTNNNIERVGTLRKTRNWKRTALGMFDVTLSAAMDFENDDDYELFLAETDFAVQLHMEAGIATGAVRNTLQIDIPRVRWQTIGIPISPNDQIEQSVEAMVLEPENGDPIFTATLVNMEATVVGG